MGTHNGRVWVRLLSMLVVALGAGAAAASDWMYYGGDAGGGRFSSLAQINRDTVGELELAWSFRTGVMAEHADMSPLVAFHATPVLLPAEAGGHLVVCTPINWIIALDPATGEERWRFDPEIELTRFAGRFNCRGTTPWRDPEASLGQACAWRLFMGTVDRRIVAIDAASGKPCEDFGEQGIVDVNPHVIAIGPGELDTALQFVSPPAVIDGVLVVGSTNNAKFRNSTAPSGMVRAFDARSGTPRWNFDTLVRVPTAKLDATPAHVGGANAWSMLSMDRERGLVFVPTASPSPDFFGVRRPGDNRYANSVIALRAATGEVAWHQQLVHHDVWDYDIPAQPMLVDITRDGQTTPVVIQLTKMGMVFTFHRETGEPFFAIEERPVPQDGMPGEDLSPTQPFPVKPPPLIPQGISPDDAWGFTYRDRRACRKSIESARHGSMYQPPSLQGTVFNPGSSGGMNWGGGAFDPTRNLLITPVSRLAFYVRFVPLADVSPEDAASPMAGFPFGPPGPVSGIDYALQQRPLMSPSFSPCTAPPWSQLVAVDMAKGEIQWKVPLGVLDKLMPFPLPLRLGTPVAGGPIVTAGGLIFMGATLDERFRAFDRDTGEELWQVATPTTANATPMTYMADGRQFVVIAAGGHMFQYAHGVSDYLLAFALPAE